MSEHVWDVESHEAPASYVTDYVSTLGSKPWCIHRIEMKTNMADWERELLWGTTQRPTLFQVYRVGKDDHRKFYGKIYGPTWNEMEDNPLVYRRYRYYWNDLLELPLYVRKKLAELNADGPWFELDHNWYNEIDRAVGNILTMQWLPSRVRNDR